MPVTVAHPAAVLPFWRTRLPMAALVIGSMVPDLPLFLRAGSGVYDFTHGPWGVFVVDVLVGLVVLTAWLLLVRNALVDVSPKVVRRRLQPRLVWSRSEWLLAAPAICLGAVTHVAWDAFTHPDRWGYHHIAWLRQTHAAGLQGYAWAQYSSGVLGIAIVVTSAGWWLLRRPVNEAPPRRLPRWTLLGLIGALGLVAAVTIGLTARHGLHTLAYDTVVNSICATALLLLALGVAHAMSADPYSRTDP